MQSHETAVSCSEENETELHDYLMSSSQEPLDQELSTIELSTVDCVTELHDPLMSSSQEPLDKELSTVEMSTVDCVAESIPSMPSFDHSVSDKSSSTENKRDEMIIEVKSSVDSDDLEIELCEEQSNIHEADNNKTNNIDIKVLDTSIITSKMDRMHVLSCMKKRNVEDDNVSCYSAVPGSTDTDVEEEDDDSNSSFTSDDSQSDKTIKSDHDFTGKNTSTENPVICIVDSDGIKDEQIKPRPDIISNQPLDNSDDSLVILDDEEGTQEEQFQQQHVMLCAQFFPMPGNEDGIIEIDSTEKMSNVLANADSKNVLLLRRSVDEIDGLNISNADLTEEVNETKSIEKQKQIASKNKQTSSSRKRVSFGEGEKLTKSIHEYQRFNKGDKETLFYTSKELQAFRIEYIEELQELHERLERQRPTGSRMLRTATAKFTEVVSCKPLIDFLFCTKHNRATI